MKRKILFALLLWGVMIITIHAQNRRELTISASMDNLSFENVGLGAGFVVEDFLFIGLDLGIDFDELEAVSARELQLGITCSADVLQQDEFFPISATVSGSFRKNNFKSDYLTDNGLIKSGTGYSIGLDLFRDFTLTQNLSLKVGLTGTYLSQTYTTEPETGLGSYDDRIFEKEIDYRYGLIAGIAIELTEKMLLSVDLKGCLNSDFHIIYGPSVSISSINAPEEE